jgi:dUTP pyrophosphatase
VVLEIPVVRIDGAGPLPVPARPGDAGLDLRSTVEVTVPAAGGRALVPTGIALELPRGHAGLVVPRSGLALGHGITCLNSPGLIDAGYRGEIGVILVNHDPRADFEVHVGDRVAQLVVVRVEQVALVERDALGASERGGGGFGHTGVA